MPKKKTANTNICLCCRIQGKEHTYEGGNIGEIVTAEMRSASRVCCVHIFTPYGIL